MKSTTGEHFVALDHVRALAAYLVFCWHFLHFNTGYPVPLDYTPSFPPFALLDEGHTGVSLFMVLSGYLFSKLLSNKTIVFRLFLWNRAIRLLPLLVVVILLAGLERHLAGKDLRLYVELVAKGILYPTLPNGGWSITTELHFYLVLPCLLWALRRHDWLPFALLGCAIALRTVLHAVLGEVQTLAYWTFVGRFDQFLLGMLAFRHSGTIRANGRWVAAALLGFIMLWWWFDAVGGYYAMPSYPSPSRLWIVLPTTEGAAYALAIAWYDQQQRGTPGPVSRLVGRLGDYSYAIYLLHPFFVFRLARLVHEHIMDLSDFRVALLWSTLAYMAMAVPGYLSFRFIEAPFLRYRKHYMRRVAAP